MPAKKNVHAPLRHCWAWSEKGLVAAKRYYRGRTARAANTVAHSLAKREKARFWFLGLTLRLNATAREDTRRVIRFVRRDGMMATPTNKQERRISMRWLFLFLLYSLA